jgi:diguanylate cyclase (GGDEF)-like protein/PAS domain S-box-containing protein
MNPPLRIPPLEYALNLIEEAVLVTDASLASDGPKVLMVNKAFEALTGQSALELVGGGVDGLLTGSPVGQMQIPLPDHIRRAVQEGAFQREESEFQRQDGSTYQLAWLVTPVKDAYGEMEFVVAALRDVTAEHQNELRRLRVERLAQFNREVIAAGLSLERIRQRVVDSALEVTRADAALVREIQGGEMVVTAVAGAFPEEPGAVAALAAAPDGGPAGCEQALLVRDAIGEDRGRVAGPVWDQGFRAGIRLPLVHQGECYGFVEVYNRQPQSLSEEDRNLLELPAGLLTSAFYYTNTYLAERRLRDILIDRLPMLIAFVDPDSRITEANDAWTEWFGKAEPELLGEPLAEGLSQPEANTFRAQLEMGLAGEWREFDADLTRADGGVRQVHTDIVPAFATHGAVTGVYIMVRDVTMARYAEVDYVTNLYNRWKFEELADYWIKVAHRYGAPLSLVMMDIDDFKVINDQFGHMMGDSVLGWLASRILETVRESDRACRWGGEEFAVLLPNTGLEEAHQLARRLRERVREQGHPGAGPVTVSIGVSELDTGGSLEGLLGGADRALYAAKQAGKDRVVVEPPGAGAD